MRGSSPKPIEQRFWPRVEKTDTCWLWTGSRTSVGKYGSLRFNGKSTTAHRVSYELINGAIPDGMVVHHVCNNPPCVRPDHLVAMSQLQNVQEMDSQQRRATGQSRGTLRTHCKNNHELVGDNVTIKCGKRRCRTCFLEAKREEGRRRRERARSDR